MRKMLSFFLFVILPWGVNAEDFSSLSVYVSGEDVQSPFRLMVVDPAGRRTGRELSTSRLVKEIPGSGYGEDSIGDDEAETPGPEDVSFILRPFSSGRYTFSLSTVKSASFKMVVIAEDVNAKDISPKNGVVNERLLVGNPVDFILEIDPTPGAPLPSLIRSASDHFDPRLFSSQSCALCGILTAQGNTQMTGPIKAGGAVSLSGNVVIKGDVVASSAIKTGNVKVIGTITQSTAPLNCVPVDLASVGADLWNANDNAKIPAKYLKNGVLNLKGTDSLALPEGKYLLQGLSLSGNAKLSGTGRVNFLVRGNADISGNAKLDGNIRLFVDTITPVTMKGNAVFTGILYSPQAAVILEGNSKLTGHIMAKELKASGNVQIK